jgi:hypothetical protein
MARDLDLGRVINLDLDLTWPIGAQWLRAGQLNPDGYIHWQPRPGGLGAR